MTNVWLRFGALAVMVVANQSAAALEPKGGAEHAAPREAVRHPAVFLTAERVAALRQMIAAREPAAQRFLDVANRRLGDPTGYDDVDVWQLALLYPLTAKSEYCKAAMTAVNARVVDDSDGHYFARDSYLRAGGDAMDIALTYDWCHQLLSQDARREWVNYLNEGIDRMWESDERHWPFGDPHNNYWYSFMEATMLTALATAGENPRADEFRQLVRRKLAGTFVPEWSLPKWAGPGGKEGMHYDKWQRRLWRILSWWRDATGEDYMGKINVTVSEQIDYWLYALAPDRNVELQWGDEPQDSEGYFGDAGRQLLLVLASLAPESVQARYAKNMLEHSPWAEFRNRGNYVWDFIYSMRGINALPIEKRTDTYLATPAAGSGKTFIRTGWTAKDSVVSYSYRARNGPSGSHDHVDKPGFLWWANGGYVVGDPNYFTRSGIFGTAQNGGALAGNIVRLESTSVDKQSPNPPLVVFSEDHSRGTVPYYYHAFDVTELWPSQKLYRREYVYLPPDILVIFDHVIGPGAKIWQINTPGKPVADGDVVRVGSVRRGLEVRNVLPRGSQARVVSWVESRVAGEQFSDGYRLEFADTAVDSRSLKVLSLNNRVQDAQLVSTVAAGSQVRITTSAGRIHVRFFDDGSHAAVE